MKTLLNTHFYLPSELDVVPPFWMLEYLLEYSWQDTSFSLYLSKYTFKYIYSTYSMYRALCLSLCYIQRWNKLTPRWIRRDSCLQRPREPMFYKCPRAPVQLLAFVCSWTVPTGLRPINETEAEVVCITPGQGRYEGPICLFNFSSPSGAISDVSATRRSRVIWPMFRMG